MLAGQAAGFLRLPQEDWDFSDAQFQEVLRSGLSNGATKVVLAGHSQAVLPQTVSQTGDSVAEDAGENRLVAGAQRAVAQSKSAETDFARRFQAFRRLPEVKSRLETGNLLAYGLFYRAESGLFLICDPAEGQFHPLT